jgi:hypothetical protein
MGFDFRVCSLVRFQTKGIKVPQMVFSVVSFAMWTFIVYLFMKKFFYVIEPESTLSQLDKLLPIGLRPGVIYPRLSNQMQVDLHTTHCRLGPTTCKADPVSVLNRSS